jgi:hypothetical protein
MRIISFAKRWGKLKKGFFSTFRYPRKDTDWTVGEKVQVFIKNRSPHRIFLGIAEITCKAPRTLLITTDPIPNNRGIATQREAKDDGFENLAEMAAFMSDYYGKDYSPDFNKLTLKWISR